VFPNVEVRHLHVVDILAEELNSAGVLVLLIFPHSVRAFSKPAFCRRRFLSKARDEPGLAAPWRVRAAERPQPIAGFAKKDCL